MSTTPESRSDFELDLDLHFLPAWAQRPPTENAYAKYEGRDESRPDRRGRGFEPRRDRPPRRDQGGGQRDQSRPPRRDFNRRDDNRREDRREAAPPPPPPLELTVNLIPEEKGVESLARQIRLTGRAYPLFDIAHLILKKPDRYNVRFTSNKKADGTAAQPLYICGLDDTMWLSEREAMDHILSKHFATFYQTERIPGEPPKGTYTFVAQCGMSGAILGPPNYHDYQNKLRKLHQERFSRLPFEAFKARIKIVRDEAIVKKWQEDQSWKTEYICLNVPEQIKLLSREDVERHFREVHFPNVVKVVDEHTVSGSVAQSFPHRGLHNAVRRAWDEQMRFPLKMVNILSQQFAGHGLQFFKVNKTFTHVAVARPRYLDLDVTPVSDGIRKIVEFINATPKCSRRKIIEGLAPNIQLPPAAVQGAEPSAESATPPPPEIAAIITDLHWLIHQGHVIEFANGLIEAAKKPAPKPPKPEKKAPEAASGPAATEGESVPAENEAVATAPATEPTDGPDADQMADARAAAEDIAAVPPKPQEESHAAPAGAQEEPKQSPDAPAAT